ncbi:MAG: hypothetical protein U0573_11495 [Phycisphaerales bacterium]|nr:hypothetical protein [Planctomycetota bacterium]
MLRTAASLGLFAAALTAGLAVADDSTWSYRALQLQYYNTESNQWLPSDVPVNYNTSALPNGIKLFGTGNDRSTSNPTLFSMTGGQYQPGGEGEFRGMRLIAVVDGVLNRPWNNAYDKLNTAFKFQIITSGGTFDMFNAQTDYGLLDASDNLLQLVGSSGATATFGPGTNDVNFQYVDGFGGPNAGDGTHIVADFVINFTWDGTANDSLVFNVDTSSIDIQQVPAPGALSVLGLGALCARRRRH